jgi:predicted site-specific integrase-resolvase
MKSERKQKSVNLTLVVGGPGDELWTHDETARFLRVTPKTLYRWNASGIGPPSRKLNGARRYWESAVREWARHQGEQVTP